MSFRFKSVAMAVAGTAGALLVAIGLAYGAFLAWGDGPRAGRAMAKGNYADALRYYDGALSASYWPRSYRTQLLVARGNAQLGLKHPDRAIADFSAALALDPSSELALALRGLVRSGSGDLVNALSDFSGALALNPDNAQVLLWRAQTYDRLLDVDRAIADYASVTHLAPQIGQAYLRQAYNLARKKDSAAAADVISNLPVTDAYNADAYIQRGSAYDMVGASDRAIASYGQAIRIDPNSALGYGERGLAYANQGDHARAMADFGRAIELDPADGRAYYNRGREEYLNGDYGAARDDFKASIGLQPDDAYQPLWLHLALVRLGETDAKTFTELLARIDRKNWPWPIIEFYLGKRDESSLYAAARADKEPSTTADRVCEAEYYVGALRRAERKTAAALPLLQRSAETCPPGFVELVAARADLRRIGN